MGAVKEEGEWASRMRNLTKITQKQCVKACHPCIYITVTKYQMKYEKLCRFVDFVSRNILVLEHKLHQKFIFHERLIKENLGFWCSEVTYL